MNSRVRIVFELDTSDPELEKRLLEAAGGNMVDWETLEYLSQFADEFQSFTSTQKKEPLLRRVNG